MTSRRVLLPALAFMLYVFLYAPIAVVIVYSFNRARYGAGWTGFTTKWYAALWDNDAALSAAWNTLLLAACSTCIATVLGTLLGIGLSRYSFPGKSIFSWLLLLPVVVPDIVFAVALLLFYGLVRDAFGLIQMGMTTMVLAHVTFQIPYVALVVRARCTGMNRVLEEAARDLGANRARTFLYVTLPLIIPGIAAGALLAFTMSLDDFVVSFFTAGPGSTTLPILIYSSVKRGITPDINALSTLIVLFSIALVLLVGTREADASAGRSRQPNLGGRDKSGPDADA